MTDSYSVDHMHMPSNRLTSLTSDVCVLLMIRRDYHVDRCCASDILDSMDSWVIRSGNTAYATCMYKSLVHDTRYSLLIR
jgi:hypothetical protein